MIGSDNMTNKNKSSFIFIYKAGIIFCASICFIANLISYNPHATIPDALYRLSVALWMMFILYLANKNIEN